MLQKQNTSSSIFRETGQERNVRVDRTEMAFDTPNLLLKHLVPEPRLEFSLAQRRRCNTHGFLTTTKQNLRGEGIMRYE